MELAHDVLRYATIAVFALLGVLGLVHQRRWGGGGEAGHWLAATFGSLALVLVSSEFIPMDAEAPFVEWVRKAEIAVLVFFPYFLWRFSVSLLGRVRLFSYLAHALTAAAVGGIFLFDRVPRADEPTSTAFDIYVAVILVQWGVLSTRVAYRLWRAGRGQTPLVRFRVYTMAAGALLLAIALVIAGQERSVAGTTWTDVIVQTMTALSAISFMLGFWPPGWMRRGLLYARRDPFMTALELTSYAPDRETIADKALGDGLQLLSARAGFITDPSGQVLARRDLDDEQIGFLVERLDTEGDSPVVPIEGEIHRNALLVPIELEEGHGCFAAISTTYTPSSAPTTLQDSRALPFSPPRLWSGCVSPSKCGRSSA